MEKLSWPALIRTLLRDQSLTAEQTSWAMNEIMEGAASPSQIAGFVVALRAKGETSEEMSGLASAMLAHSTPITVPGRIVDLVGTGGDGMHTVNISTMATIVAAAAGARMAKHGNRAASSSCGAADVLEELGVVIDLPVASTVALAEEVGAVFLFAPLYHPAFRHTAVPRRELGVPTAFNFLGPLTNPARPNALAVGVADPRMAPVLAGVLAERGVSAVVFHGGDGLDELTTTTTSSVWVVSPPPATPSTPAAPGTPAAPDASAAPASSVQPATSAAPSTSAAPVQPPASAPAAASATTFDPQELGLARASVADLRGGDAARNAAVARAVLSGEHGPVRDIVLLNAAAALTAEAGVPDADSLTSALTTHLARATEAIDSGAAAALLDRWAMTSQRLAAKSLYLRTRGRCG